MKLDEVLIACLTVCAVVYTRASYENPAKAHKLIKRQAQDIHSPSVSSRQFVSPNGEPYFKYQPPVRSSRESLPGRQATQTGEVPSWKEATTRVRIAGAAGSKQAVSSATSGAHGNGASNPLLGGSRGRTYKYPFGKERVQYTGLQPQGYINETQGGGDYNGGNGVVDPQQDTVQQQQQQQHYQQQQRYSSISGSASQRSASNYQNDSSHVPSNQDTSATAAQEQETRRRHDELRRRHEEERRRQEEERRKLIEERRKKSEERRRLYYEQQQQRANQQRGHGQEGTESQQSGLHGNRQGVTIPTANTQQRAGEYDQSNRQHVQRMGKDNQQEHPASSNQQATSSVSQQRRQLPQHQQSAYDNSGQDGPQPQQPVYSGTQLGGYPSQPRQSANSGSQQGGYLPQHQQSIYSDSQQTRSQQQQSNSGSRQSGYLPPHQQPTYSGSQQNGYLPPHQQSTYSGSQQAGSQQQQSNNGARQGVYVPPHHESTYSGSQPAGSQPQQPTISGSQQRGYQPQSQQQYYSGSQHGGYIPQQPVYNPAQRHSPDRQPVFRLNNTHSTNPQNRPQRQGFSQVDYQQSGQVDPRINPRSNFSSAGSNRDYLGQGQGQRYPYPGTGANSGSSFSYEQQDTDLDCPDTGIDLRINGVDCHQAVQQFGTYLCYTHEFTSKDCCQVCRPRKQITRTGCEYGDHAELCSTITAADCYDLRNRYSCCETCERLKRPHLPVGCEYGDMTVRCDNVRQNPGLCYVPDNQRLCCETCNQIRNITNTGCPWGDYHSNLCQLFEENTSNVRINCYSKQRQKLCCQSCERLRDWISTDLPAGCQYGDRPVIFTTTEFGRLNCSTLFSYFSTDECRTNDAVATNCCHTCHRLLNHRG